MSFVLLSVLLFLYDHFSNVFFPEKRNKIITKRLYEKLKLFLLIADCLFLSAFSFRLVLSRIEPLLIHIVLNLDELASVEGIREVIESIQSYITLDITPMDLSLILVVFLAYFGSVIAPGLLCAISLIVESYASTVNLGKSKYATENYPQVPLKGKLFLKLCHLLN